MKKKTLTMTLGVMLAALLMACAGVEIVGGPVSPDTLQDGVYEGLAKNGSVKVKVAVTIKDQRIAAIKILQHRTWKGKPAEPVIPPRIIAKQSTRVDAVSGATISSTAIMNAVEDAVQKARTS